MSNTKPGTDGIKELVDGLLSGTVNQQQPKVVLAVLSLPDEDAGQDASHHANEDVQQAGMRQPIIAVR